jgi:hypothetical protein
MKEEPKKAWSLSLGTYPGILLGMRTYHEDCVFVDDILDDISKLKRTTKKDDLFAYIDSWKTNLKTIKTITEL